nr:MAG: major capsid protein [Microvirus sp.]
METKVGYNDVNDQSRWPYDLSAWAHVCGNIGGLQTLAVYPTVAGDSFELNAKMQFKFSPMVRSMAQDALIDLFAFYVPHRHIYPNWSDWLKGGYDEGTTLGSITVPGGLGYISVTGRVIESPSTIPTWCMAGYSRIWNRYFKHPTTADIADDYLLGASVQERIGGVACCYPKAIWNTGMFDSVASADRDYTVSGSVVDLPDFALQQARYETEINRDWFSIRYQDLLKNTWGGDANIDADQRPELIMRNQSWLSGWDVESTDQASVGSYTGRAAGIAEITVPRKYIPEHGTIWIMALVRFPPVAVKEVHYLSTKPEPTYQQLAGDPVILQNSEPIQVAASDHFADGGVTALERIPYAQWYRTQPHYVHNNFSQLTGHPFILTPATATETKYVTYLTYQPMFRNLNLLQWHCNGLIDCTAYRVIPPPKSSIYAGSNK